VYSELGQIVETGEVRNPVQYLGLHESKLEQMPLEIEGKV